MDKCPVHGGFWDDHCATCLEVRMGSRIRELEAEVARLRALIREAPGECRDHPTQHWCRKSGREEILWCPWCQWLAKRDRGPGNG